jgi:hypothetical protein
LTNKRFVFCFFFHRIATILLIDYMREHRCDSINSFLITLQKQIRFNPLSG